MESTRCSSCSKKIGIATTFTCKCSSKYCALHRMPESHSCSSLKQIREEELSRLEKKLEKVVAAKIIVC
jgi:predicted nucleic acid binding AN1-type Zn finger protein